jgi:hypothetical protein
MVQFTDFDAIVRSKEFQQKIQRSLGSSTVALFALLHDHGSGMTLIDFDRDDARGVAGRRWWIVDGFAGWRQGILRGISFINGKA